MDKIYLKDNYIVTELGGVIAVFPKNYSSYSENTTGFYLNSSFPVNNPRTVYIDFTRVTSIYDEAGLTAYSVATLRSFFLTNTGFKSPSGGSGGVWGSITGTLSDQTDLQSALNAKQNTLISGTNIKTINGNTLLGSGDLTISTGITVGTTPVTSGTDGRVFFQSGGVVQQDAGLTYNNSTGILQIKQKNQVDGLRIENQSSSTNFLEVYNLDVNATRFESSGYHIFRANTRDSFEVRDTYVEIKPSSFTRFFTGTTEISRITSTGLGIGTTSPQARLDVRAQGALSTDIAFRVRNSADTLNFAQFNGDGTYFLSSSGGALDNAFSRISDGRMFMAKSGANFIELNPSGANRLYNPSGGWNLEGNSSIATKASGSNTGTGTFYFYAGNLQIGTGLIASAAASMSIWMTNGTAPAVNAADRHWYYSADIVAGNAAPHFRTENGSIIKLFKGAALTASDGTLANAVTRIGELEARLQAAGLIA